MLCCVGLIGGLAVGQSLGGHWIITAPAAGFALGLYGDMKFMHRMHGQNSQHYDQKTKMSLADSSPKQDDITAKDFMPRVKSPPEGAGGG